MKYDSIPFSKIVEIRDRLLLQDNPCRLESGDPEFNLPEKVKEVLCKAVYDNQTHYTNSAGIIPLREAIQIKLRKTIEKEFSKDEIIVTNGAMHGLYCIFSSLIEKGDKVGIAMPNWVGCTNIAKSCGAEIVPFSLDMPLEEQPFLRECKVILINSPHNPTGRVLFENELLNLVRFAIKYNMYLISDEAYEHIIYDTEHISPLSLAAYDRIIGVFSFSKSYAMPGLRLGYVVTKDIPLMNNLKKAVLYSANGVNSVTQYAGVTAILESDDFIRDMVKAYKVKRDLLVEAVNSCKGLKCDVPNGAFYVWVECEQPAVKIVNELLDKGVGAIKGTAFGGSENTFRFAYSCPLDHIVRASEIIKGLKI